jgi:hypothetical protein
MQDRYKGLLFTSRPSRTAVAVSLLSRHGSTLSQTARARCFVEKECEAFRQMRRTVALPVWLTVQGASKRFLQALKLTSIYSQDMYSALNCHNVT